MERFDDLFRNDPFFKNVMQTPGNTYPLADQAPAVKSSHSSFSNVTVDQNGSKFEIQKCEFQDSSGNRAQFLSRSIGNVGWVQGQLQNAQGFSTKRESLVNLNESEKIAFDNEWQKRSSVPFFNRLQPNGSGFQTMVGSEPVHDTNPMKLAEEVVFPFLDESARLIKKQLENLAQFQPMDTIKIEQATPSPAVAQIKAPTPDKPKEGWTSWTLRMLRIY